MNSSINWHTWLVSFLPHAQQGLSGRFPEPSYLLRSSPLPGSSPPLLASLTPGLLAIPDPSPPPQTSDLLRSLHCPTVLWSQTLWHPAGWLAGCPPWCTERQLAFLLTVGHLEPPGPEGMCVISDICSPRSADEECGVPGSSQVGSPQLPWGTKSMSYTLLPHRSQRWAIPQE